MVKRRVNLYLDNKLVELAHLEIPNLSEAVNNLLEAYLSTNGMEQTNKKLAIAEAQVKALKERKAQMIKQGIKETKIENMSTTLLDELKEVYRRRREEGVNNQHADEVWITSPKNQSKARTLKKNPLELLAEIKEWYENEVKGNEQSG